MRTFTKKHAILQAGRLLVAFACSFFSLTAHSQTYVDAHGRLKVVGAKMVDKNNQPIQLKGMSLFWSSYGEGSPYFTENTVRNLWQNYKCTVVRIPLGIAPGTGSIGYEDAQGRGLDQALLVSNVVDACVKYGIYAVIDFHAHNAITYETQAKTFFTQMANKYKDVPNVLYEIWNEPTNESWGQIKPYHERMINVIRAIDPNGIIICGSGSSDQKVDEIVGNKINATNIMYSMHFYAASQAHQFDGSWLGPKVRTAVNNGIPLFVTEYGTVEYTGAGTPNKPETQKWWDYLDSKTISHCNWSISRKAEGASAITPTTKSVGNWTAANLTESGEFVLNHIKNSYDGTITGLEEDEAQLNAGVHVFPNPSSDGFTLDQDGAYTYTISNNTGLVVENGTALEEHTIGKNLTSGSYILTVETNGTKRFHKLIKK